MKKNKKSSLKLTQQVFDDFLQNISQNKTKIAEFFDLVLEYSRIEKDGNIVVEGKNTYKSIEEIVYRVLDKVRYFPERNVSLMISIMTLPHRDLLWECCCKKYEIWRAFLCVATDSDIKNLALQAREPNVRMAAIKYMAEQKRKKFAIMAIAKMLPEFWEFNENANLIEDIFEAMQNLKLTYRVALPHFVSSGADDMILRTALYIIYCVFVDKDPVLLEHLISAIKEFPVATQETLRKTYNELLDDSAFGWKYCTGQMPLHDSPQYVHLISERYRKLFDFRKAYNFDVVVGNQTLDITSLFTDRTIQTACWLIIDPMVGRSIMLGQLHRKLGWYFENVAFINSANNAASWLLESPENTLIVVVGNQKIDRYTYHHDLVPILGSLLAATSQSQAIKDRILFVLVGKEFVVDGLCRVHISGDSDDDLTAHIKMEHDSKIWISKYERRVILPIVEELIYRVGFNTYFDGQDKHEAYVLRLRRSNKDPIFNFIILEDISIRIGDETPMHYESALSAQTAPKLPQYLMAKLSSRITSVVNNLLHRFVPERGQSVNVSVVYPPVCKPATNFIVEGVLHLSGYELIVAGTHRAAPNLTTTQINPGTRLIANLIPPKGFSVDEAEAILTWTPPIVRVPFLINVDKCVKPGTYLPKLVIYSKDVIPIELVRVYFALNVEKNARVVSPLDWLIVHRKFPKSAFASYSTKDWERVKERVDALRPFMDVFLDCLDLKQGQGWEETIKQELDKCDTLILFWSRAAKASKWVKMEWTHTLKYRGIEYITPNSLEPPEVCPPPKKLRSLNFGSPLLLMKGRGTETFI